MARSFLGAAEAVVWRLGAVGGCCMVNMLHAEVTAAAGCVCWVFSVLP